MLMVDTETGKVSVLSSGKIGKYQYLTGNKNLPFCSNWVSPQADFTYSSLEKPFEEQANAIKEHVVKQINAIMNQIGN